MNSTTRPPGGIPAHWADRITRVITGFAHWITAHWLFVGNLALALYVGLPVLAAALLYAGFEVPGRLIHLGFWPLCHQLPERSFFLFGEQTVYSYEQIGAVLGGSVPNRFQGNEALGFKLAMCQRDMAIFGAALLAGLAFNLVRGRLRPLSWRGLALMSLPMAIDGFGQLFGLWSSTWVSRLVTGGLFGVAGVWLLYPYVQEAMSQVNQDLKRSVAALRSEGAPEQ